MRDSIPQEQKHIYGYYLITPNTVTRQDYSRIILLAKEEVQLRIMDECMADDIPVIWVKLVTRERKQIVIGGNYREHHLLLQQMLNTTDDKQLQINRWNKTLIRWKSSARNTKCIMIGDINMDCLRWQAPEHRVQKMVQSTKDEVKTMGFYQIIKGITRAWPGQSSALGDQICTNSPGNIISTNNTVREQHQITITLEQL